jgi:hypothetical protein
VAATYKAKESLAAKGLTPAIFLDRFYRERNKTSIEVALKPKEKEKKLLPDFIVIDIDDYNLIKSDQKNKESEDIDEEVLNKKIVESLNQ